MTLAHELCHLLVDHQSDTRGLALVSPRPRAFSASGQTPSFFSDFNLVEARANAFAAHFLVPTAGIIDVIDGGDPTSERAISAVGRHFGVGRVVAVNRIDHVYGLGAKIRAAMCSRSAQYVHSPSHRDAVADVGLLTGETRRIVLSGVIAGRLDAVKARSILHIPLTEPLPDFDGLTERQRSPLQRTDSPVFRVAQQYLDASPETEDLVAIGLQSSPNGWVVNTARVAFFNARPDPVDLQVRVPFDLDPQSVSHAHGNPIHVNANRG